MSVGVSVSVSVRVRVRVGVRLRVRLRVRVRVRVPLLLHHLRALQLVPGLRQRADGLGASALEEAVRRAATQRRTVDVLAEDLPLKLVRPHQPECVAAIHQGPVVVLAVHEAAVDAAVTQASAEVLAHLWATSTATSGTPPTTTTAARFSVAVRVAAARAAGAVATHEIAAHLPATTSLHREVYSCRRGASASRLAGVRRGGASSGRRYLHLTRGSAEGGHPADDTSCGTVFLPQ